MREAEDLVQIIGHFAVLAVDEVERGDEVRRGDAHEGLDHRHLFLATALRKDVVIEFGDDRQVSLVAEVKIRESGGKLQINLCV